MADTLSRGDLEIIALELWSAVSDLSTLVERLTDADDADMAPIRTALNAASARITAIRSARIAAAQEASHA